MLEAIRRCKYCNKELPHIAPSRLKVGKGKYCNKICFFKDKYGENCKIPSEFLNYEKRHCKGCGKELPHIPPTRIKDGRGKYCSKSCFFKYADHRRNKIPSERFILSPEFAYCLGAFKGDGYSSKRGNSFRVSLAVIDKDFINTFNKSFSFWSGLKAKVYRHKGRQELIITFCSCDLGFFVNFDLNKLLEAEPKVMANFIKGFADAEGYIRFKKYNRHIKIVNCRLELIQLCQKLLKKLNIESRIYPIGETREWYKTYQLYIGKQKNIKNYYQKIGFSIWRKEKVLADAVNNYVNNMGI